MMTYTPCRILVLGGTGFVGRSLCEQAVRRWPGVQLRVPSRRPARASLLRTLPQVELVAANVHDPRALRSLLQGVDAVVNLVAILHGRPEHFAHVHQALPQHLAQAMGETGVRRLVHVSALGVDPASPMPSDYLRSKAEGEALLAQAAQTKGLQLTVLRPSVIFGAQDRFLNLFAQLQALFPVMPLAGADARFQPVWVEDVAAAAIQSLALPGTAGQTIECAGPEVLRLRDLVALAGRWSGHARAILPLPEALGLLQAGLLGLLPGEPLMSPDNLRSMRRPNVASGQLPGLASLGITPRSLSDIGPQYLGADPSQARLDRWRGQHR